MTRTARVLLMFLFTAGCGGPNHPSGTADEWYPLAEGNVWNYRITENGASTEKRREVIGQASIAGERAWILESIKGAERVVAWNDYSPETGVRRFRDERYSTASGDLVETSEYEPFTLRMPPPGTDADFAETYTERSTSGGGPMKAKEKVHRWSIVSTSEEITVPAGTFRTLHVRRLNANGTKARDFWYAAGVGKVKETGDFVEELVSYEVASGR